LEFEECEKSESKMKNEEELPSIHFSNLSPLFLESKIIVCNDDESYRNLTLA
jgi:hypothetical protein